MEVVQRFVTDAASAEESGSDGIQIHGAHGYLVSQFLSPLATVRTDGWEETSTPSKASDRDRTGIRATVGSGFAVGVKLNSADFRRGGFTEEESRRMIEMLAEESIDLIEISGGSYESPAMMGRGGASESTRAREGYFLEFAATACSVARDVPLAVTGGFRTRAGMQQALDCGACDVVGIGRPTALMPRAGAHLVEDTTRSSPSARCPCPCGADSPRAPPCGPWRVLWTCNGIPISCTGWVLQRSQTSAGRCGSRW